MPLLFQRGLHHNIHQVGYRGTNLGLQDLFGECNDQRISNIYNHTIQGLDDKAQGLFQQPCLEQWKDNFPTFARVIEHKLGEAAYGGLQFHNF